MIEGKSSKSTIGQGEIQSRKSYEITMKFCIAFVERTISGILALLFKNINRFDAPTTDGLFVYM